MPVNATETPNLSLLRFGAPIKSGAAPSLASATYKSRLLQLFETLNAGWTGYHGHPWVPAYSAVLADVAGLHSLRLAVLDPPGSILLESSFEGDQAAHLESLRTALGPLLDVVFCNAEAYAGTRDRTGDQFAAWVSSLQPGAALGAAAATAAELTCLAPSVGSAASVASPDAFAFAVHSAADLERLSNLYVSDDDRTILRRAARCLLATLPAQLEAKANDADQAVKDRFAEVIAWFQGTAPASEPIVCPAMAGASAAGSSNIQVNGKKLVMQVLTDIEDNYSNSGYLDRMAGSFGRIYLGLDRTDPNYALQSSASNRAIGTITEQDAFAQAINATRDALRAPGASFDIKDISDKVLAALCTYWFDIPDGNSVISSGSVLPFPPARCPGHFAPPSGYIFQPEPGWAMKLVGELDGRILRSHVADFVAAQRRAGIPPNGVLSKALFAAFPKSPDDDDLLTRTLIGVMIGFLPTVQGNLVAAMAAWKGAMLDSMRHDFLSHPEKDIYERASQVIRGPLMAGMQQAPVPPAVWRTAVKAHDLGDNPIVHVKPGDRLFVNIDSATREDLGKNIADVSPVFGGDRSLNPHPTHACPGFWMGMGVLLGIIAGTLEAAPTLAPMTASRASAVF